MVSVEPQATHGLAKGVQGRAITARLQNTKLTCVDVTQNTTDGRAQDLLAACCHGRLQPSLPLILGSLQPPLSLLIAVLFAAAVFSAALLLSSQAAVRAINMLCL